MLCKHLVLTQLANSKKMAPVRATPPCNPPLLDPPLLGRTVTWPKEYRKHEAPKKIFSGGGGGCHLVPPPHGGGTALH